MTVKDKRAEYDALTKKPKTMVFEAITKAAEPTDSQLAKISKYALRQVTADEVYVREINLANDQVDRSFERFDSGYLQRFAETIVGKSVLIGHDHGGAPVGRFFEAEVSKGPNGWNWLVARFYMPKTPSNQQAIDNIDYGIWSFASIGGSVDYKGLVCDICKQPYYYWLSDDESAARCPHVSGNVYDGVTCTTTWDSTRSDMQIVEAVEGSIVYLGCQYEAAIAKSAEADNELKTIKESLLLESITPPGGETLEDGMEIEKLKADLSAKAVEVQDLSKAKDDLTTKVSELTPLAETGKKLTERLVTEIKRLAACLGDTVTPTVVDEIKSVDKLIELEEKLGKAWAEKRGPVGEGEHVAGGQQATKTKPVNENAFGAF